MVTIWFLLVLMSIQDGTPLIYKGFMGYNSQEECMKRAIMAENYMAKLEEQRGRDRTVWTASHCIPFDIFIPKHIPSNNGDTGA